MWKSWVCKCNVSIYTFLHLYSCAEDLVLPAGEAGKWKHCKPGFDIRVFCKWLVCEQRFWESLYSDTLFSFLYHHSHILHYFIPCPKILWNFSWKSHGRVCIGSVRKEVLSWQLQNQVEVAVFWIFYSLYFRSSECHSFCCRSLLAQSWFCTVCVKWGMAEIINSEAFLVLLEDLVYWRRKWGCSSELFFF